MSIKTEVSVAAVEDRNKFPKLRRFRDRGPVERVYGPLVVLFVSDSTGLALSGVEPERIGILQAWSHVDSETWSTCSITLTSTD